MIRRILCALGGHKLKFFYWENVGTLYTREYKCCRCLKVKVRKW
jgi:hypothetical protein